MRYLTLTSPKKQTQTNPVLSAVEWANFKPDDGFSAYYKRDFTALRSTRYAARATYRRVTEY